ncbi:MAG: HlyC/CorC family transporter [Chlorobiales bacterium]|nr:HlyC/CorC family transporter [Chlorobiales bacterium]
MDESAFEIVIILILILANGVFSMSEIALISSRQARLQQLANEGNRKAKLALKLAKNPGQFLSTIQVGITLVGVLTGAFGGATLSEPVAAYLSKIDYLSRYSEQIAFGLVVLVITYLTLILGELVPKHIGLRNPERLATFFAPLMQFLFMIAAPIVHFLNGSTNLMLRLLGIKASDEPPVTEEEIKLLLQQGTQVGVFEAVEHDMVLRIFRMSDRRASTIMTPRTDIEWIDLKDPEEDIRKMLIESAHSRFPVAEGDLDNVLGILHIKDLTSETLGNSGSDLKTCIKRLLQKPAYVPESVPAFNTLEVFKKSREHLSLVIDEHGSIQGIVTLNDVLEAIVGDIPGGDEPQEESIVRRADGSWLVDGMLPIDEFMAFFNLRRSPEEDNGGYQTLGGFVMTKLGHVPNTSDQFDWKGVHFEVVDMDGKRVDKVLVTAPEKTHSGQSKAIEK